MSAFKLALLAGALFGSASGVRLSKGSASLGLEASKFIAGVPVYNYHLAFQPERAASFLQATKGESEPGREHWIVMLKEGVTDERIDALCETFRQCKQHGHAGGVPFLEVVGSEAELEAMVENAKDTIEFVEPDMPISIIPELPAAGGEANYSSFLEADAEAEAGAAQNPNSWGLNRIGVPATSPTNRNGAGVNVYVLDTGIRISHSEFGGRARATLEVLGQGTRLCNNNPACAADRQGHGTHCAGTVGARRFGVAPGATLHAVKVLGDNGSGAQAWSLAALDWIATSGARPAIASMSLGAQGTSAAERAGVDRTVNAGVSVIVAAGNSASDACRFQPAFVPSAITVGSTQSGDQMSGFSNWGPCVNIFAPGSSIPSAGHLSDTQTTTLSGTSMACPHVSGAAALLLQGNRGLSPAAIMQNLASTAFVNVVRGNLNGAPNRLLRVR
jgi:aqualysin 1